MNIIDRDKLTAIAQREYLEKNLLPRLGWQQDASTISWKKEGVEETFFFLDTMPRVQLYSGQVWTYTKLEQYVNELEYGYPQYRTVRLELEFNNLYIKAIGFKFDWETVNNYLQHLDIDSANILTHELVIRDPADLKLTLMAIHQKLLPFVDWKVFDSFLSSLEKEEDKTTPKSFWHKLLPLFTK